jgi:hypothetical protein
VVRSYKNLQVPRGLPNTAQVIQGHSNCGFNCGLETPAFAGQVTDSAPGRSSPTLACILINTPTYDVDDLDGLLAATDVGGELLKSGGNRRLV